MTISAPAYCCDWLRNGVDLVGDKGFTKIVGNGLPYVADFAEAAAREAYYVTEPSGTIRVFSSSGGGQVWLEPLRRAGFENVRIERGYAVGEKPGVLQ